MDAKLNRLSMLLGVPGLLLQIGSRVAVNMLPVPEEMTQADANTALLLTLGMFVGTGLLIAGLSFYARAKARHWAWCFFGLLGIIGVIVLACLKDREKDQVVEVRA